ncbi:peptidoglycan glycosyltransferase [Lewinellaceae bacterium SD302]|nr:peptidoglycan glycosyltransferase [Lewinellaceae bacterium SD302]
MALTVKNDVLLRVYVVLAVLIGPIAGLLMYRTVDIAVLNKAESLEESDLYVKEVPVEAERGNVYSHDGNLLATSVPYFELHFDPFVAPPRVYYKKLDSLAYLLAHELNDGLTVGAWRDSLLSIRDSTSARPVSRYVKLANAVDFASLRRIQEFPIFNLGRFRGGLIPQKRSERKRPFGMLGSRTVGYSTKPSARFPNGRKVGVEGAFDKELAGKSGKAKMFRVDPKNDLWMPVEDLSVVESTVGEDVYTTIDVNMQDIAENALLRAARIHKPEWGTAIVMDVKTGAVRAIANLGETTDGKNYYEMFNYAIAMATEPGSTFKLATMMALLEDGYVTLDSEVDIEHGIKEFYDRTLRDDNPLSKRWDTITVQKAFEQSSNVGMAKLVDSFYHYNEFSDRLKSFHLNDQLGLEIEGEASSLISDTSFSTFSGVSKAWMAIGYESLLTPLQMLTFYNAVANDGKMMKPYFVDRVAKEGKVSQQFAPTVIDEQIASRRTIDQLQLLLEGVVERGTAKKLKTNNYRFAGKTGTSQQNYGRRRGKKKYQASFAGYFPADNPRYSAIVVIYNPRSGAYYGGEVAGPVFREIADKAYNAMIDIHEPLNRGPKPVLYASQLPQNDAGKAEELSRVLDFVNVELDTLPPTSMARLIAEEEKIGFQAIVPANQQYPNVKGMRLRDAIFLLENKGYVVHPKGVGRVVRMEWHSDGQGGRGKDVDLYLR